MSLEEAQGTEGPAAGSSGFRKVHAFVLESSILIWDPDGKVCAQFLRWWVNYVEVSMMLQMYRT